MCVKKSNIGLNRSRGKKEDFLYNCIHIRSYKRRKDLALHADHHSAPHTHLVLLKQRHADVAVQGVGEVAMEVAQAGLQVF